MLGAIHMVACLRPSVCVMICGGPGAQPASPYLLTGRPTLSFGQGRASFEVRTSRFRRGFVVRALRASYMRVEIKPFLAVKNKWERLQMLSLAVR